MAKPRLLSLISGIIIAIIGNPAATVNAEDAIIDDSNNLDNNLGESSTIVTGADLLTEMQHLHTALSQVQSLLLSADIPADDEIMSKAAKLVRRVRSLVYATNLELGMMPSSNHQHSPSPPALSKQDEIIRRRMVRVERRRRMRKIRRGQLGEHVKVKDVVEEDSPATALQHDDVREQHLEEEEEDNGRALIPTATTIEDDVTRNLYEETITFPECNEKLLEDCLQILNEQLILLQLDAQFIIHEKRNANQEGYNKVVLITDLTATNVKGKLNDGIVSYPFLWDDAVEGYPRTLGVNGQWDCHALSPEDCCALITASAPNPDTKGNYIQCHIFVPFGGVGNKKRSDRVFINLSPDGRVHEPPMIA